MKTAATATPQDSGEKKIGIGGHIDSIRGKAKKRIKIIFGEDSLIKKNGLSLAPHSNSFICKELYETEERFDKLFSGEEGKKALEESIEEMITSVRKDTKLRKTSENDNTPEDERRVKGEEIFDEEVSKIKEATKDFTPMKKLLFWLGDYWWYYNTEFRNRIHISFPDKDLVNQIARKFLSPSLPEPIQESTKEMRIANLAIGYGHFAILFVDADRKTRRIVTDTQALELHGVYGYSYLDIGPGGNPIARSVCDEGGGRCFFDGERLMVHRRFQTCAPKTTIIEGGYKVSSTNCTIINGKLYPLIDSGDTVAHTTGAVMGCCSFSTQEALESYKKNEESGTRTKVKNGEATFDGTSLKPKGIFLPSHTKLLDNGFTLFEFSEFHEIENYIYNKITIVDDREDFTESAMKAFKGIPKRNALNTGSKKAALEHILRENPDAALLDMHLTPEEEFDGLWIANKLIEKGYKGEIMIVSGYGKESLQAMRKLIKKDNVHIPGKDLGEINKCLLGKCNCLR